MRKGKWAFYALFFIGAILFGPTGGRTAENILVNEPQEEMNEDTEGKARQLSPGALILMPDGGRTIIDSVMPDGSFKTEAGVIIMPDGSLPDSDSKVEILRSGVSKLDLHAEAQVVLPDDTFARIVEKLPDGNWKTDVGAVIAPDGTIVAAARSETAGGKNLPESGASSNESAPKNKKEEANAALIKINGAHAPAREEKAKENPAKPKTVLPAQKPAANKASEMPANAENLTLAQMLPMTRLPGAAETPQGESEKNQSGLAPESKAKKAPENRKAEEKKAGAGPAEKSAASGKKPVAARTPENKENQPRTAAKTPVGKELRIPPEAAKTGNLNFLEGCWQGTRPEYYSKRTIKECFCFGANGANGKRRVYDPSGPRMCIGSTKAHLSSGGVLSVTSSGAACDDGERWGQAEMECRNSGPRTPCSWIFKDANNGRQAYQIPFVRVESCGR